MKKAFYFIAITVLFAFIDLRDTLYSDYLFPKSVNDELLSYIEKQKIDSTKLDFFAIVGTFKDTVYVNLLEYDSNSNSKLSEIISTSNRRIDLGKWKITVLSKVDLLYSSKLFLPNENGAYDEIIFGGGGFSLAFFTTKNKKSIILNKGIKP